jgi:DNA invertase Pin-like site-specific DNA recombinase
MLVGYARVSTQDQNLNLQKDALKKTGCEKIYTDVGSGAHFDRKGLSDALAFMREGDCLVVWKLDRLGRSLKDLIETINDIHRKKMCFQSLQENLNTATSAGKLVFHVFGALAEFERDIIRDRTRAGLNAARARGRLGGRPRILDQSKVGMAKILMADHSNTIKNICKTLRVSKSTLYRSLKLKEIII